MYSYKYHEVNQWQTTYIDCKEGEKIKRKKDTWENMNQKPKVKFHFNWVIYLTSMTAISHKGSCRYIRAISKFGSRENYCQSESFHHNRLIFITSKI